MRQIKTTTTDCLFQSTLCLISALCCTRLLVFSHLAGLDLRKKSWGQLAPKFIDLVAKKFSALRAKDFSLKISFDTVKLHLLLSLLLSLFLHITLICLDFFSSKVKET